MDITAWLHGLDLGQYEAAFRDAGVDATVLPALTAEDLKEIGVATVGHRRTLLKAIAGLKSVASGPASRATPAPRDAPDAERRQLTVLFCDLAGSTALSTRLDPEDLREVMAAYHRAVTDAVQHQGGYVAKLLGDGVLAYFGWPRAREDNAERAVRAGLAACDAVAGLGSPTAPLAARVGIATGPVVVGEVLGEGEARERGVVGETPNLAARLQDAVGPGMVAADATTRRLTGTLFEWADLGEVALKGFLQPVRIWRVLGRSGVESRFEALRGAATQLPLIGREEELDLLLRRWRQACTGEGQLVLVSGEAGIGKSRLLTALQETLQEEEHATLQLSCAPDRQTSALSPIIASLGRHAGFARDDGAEEFWRKLRSVMPMAGADGEELGLIAELLSPPEEWLPRLPDMSPQRRKERTFNALLRMIGAQAGPRPLLLLLEDAHWADPSTLDLLDKLVVRLPRLRCLLVITHRLDFVPPWAGRTGVSPLLLSCLSQVQSAQLIRFILGEKTLSPALVTRIAARADGVPLFVEELTRAVIEAGRDEPELGVPTTLQASLTARLDRHALARQAAQLGAVIGRSFKHDLVAGVSELTPAALEAGLRHLVAAGLVLRQGEPPEATYRFSHVLLQDAAYETLLRSRRRTLHGRLLRLLEERHPELIEQEPETLARHAELAGVATSAAHYRLRAGQQAMRTYALHEAEAHFNAGLRLLTAEGTDTEHQRLRLDLQIGQGQALMALRGYADPAVSEAFARARGLALELRDPVRGFAVLHGHFMFDLVGGRSRAALATAERMRTVGQMLGSEKYRLAGSFYTGVAELFLGRFVPALYHMKEAATLVREVPEASGKRDLNVRDLNVMARVYQSWALLALGEVAAADETDRQAWMAAEASHGSFAVSSAYCMSCAYSLVRGDGPSADRKVAVGLRRCGEEGYAVWSGAAAVIEALSALENGRLAEGAAVFLRRMVAYRATGSMVMVASGFGRYAEGLLRLDRTDEALAAADEGIAAARSAEDFWYEAELHRIRGGVLVARGDEGAARTALETAISVARSQAAVLWEMRAALRMVPLVVKQEGVKAARRLMHDVLSRMPVASGAEEIGHADGLLNSL